MKTHYDVKLGQNIIPIPEYLSKDGKLKVNIIAENHKGRMQVILCEINGSLQDFYYNDRVEKFKMLSEDNDTFEEWWKEEDVSNLLDDPEFNKYKNQKPNWNFKTMKISQKRLCKLYNFSSEKDMDRLYDEIMIPLTKLKIVTDLEDKLEFLNDILADSLEHLGLKFDDIEFRRFINYVESENR